MPRDSIDPHGIVKKLKTFATRMRRQMTPAESFLLPLIKERFAGERPGAQVPFGFFILDFVVRDRMVAFELDGSSHDGREWYDSSRDAFILRHGVTVLRFSNTDAMADPHGVLRAVEAFKVVPPSVYDAAKRLAREEKRSLQSQKLARHGLRFNHFGGLVGIPSKSPAPLDATKSIAASERIVSEDGKRSRPRCPHCGRAIGQKWTSCHGCGAVVIR